MATVRLKLGFDANGNLRIPVTIINPKNKKTVVAQLLPDTGANTTSISNKYARTLGIDNIKSGTPQNVNGVPNAAYSHTLHVKIGTLKPVASRVNIDAGNANFSMDILGVDTMLQVGRATYQGGYITFTEEAPPPVVKPTPKQAAYAYANSYLSAWTKYKRI